MINQNFQDMLNDKEQMINYFSLEISELLCDYPSEMDIEGVEKILNVYTKILLNNRQ